MTNFPDKVDILIVGTGLYESLLSAALSCIGVKVLHVDSNSFYGDLWSSFSFQNLLDLVDNKESSSPFLCVTPPDLLKPNIENEEESYIKFVENYMNMSELKIISNSKMVNTNGKETACSYNNQSSEDAKNTLSNVVIDDISKLNRYFNIDISPKLLMGGSDLVDILLKSTASKYVEFQRVTSLLAFHNDQFCQVPCSRSEIFKSNQITLKEKRLLMKFITYVINQNQQSSASQTDENNDGQADLEKLAFGEFLDNFGMTPTLKHYIIHTVAGQCETGPALEGIAKTYKFIMGLAAFQKYGTSESSDLKTPYLFPVYGSGELPQAFCRLSAVYGGTYMLNIRLDGILETKIPGDQTDSPNQNNTAQNSSAPTTKSKSRKALAALINGQRVDFSHLVLPQKYAQHVLDPLPFQGHKFSRAIFITDFSLLTSTDDTEKGSSDEISFLRLLPTQGDYPHEISMLELSSITYCVPPNYHLYHVSCDHWDTSAQHTLEPIIKKILASSHPDETGLREPLWTLYFAVPAPLPFDFNEGIVKDCWENLTICPGPSHEFTYSDQSFQNLRCIFEEVSTRILKQNGNLSVDLSDNDRNLFRFDISKSSLFHGSGDND